MLQSQLSKLCCSQASIQLTQHPIKTSQGDIRHYAVWVVSGRPDLRGVWHGPHPLCWERLAAQLPGRRAVGGVRLKRAASLEEAFALYAREAARHGAPLPPPLHSVP